MNSQTLKENGFDEFFPLKELCLSNVPSDEPSVFVLIDRTLSGKPTSDILYIGRSKKPIKKILGGYLGGSGGKTVQRIHKALFNDGFIEKISISFATCDDAKASQKELLEEFRHEHGDSPNWNAPKKQPTKKQPKQKQAKTRGKEKQSAQTA